MIHPVDPPRRLSVPSPVRPARARTGRSARGRAATSALLAATFVTVAVSVACDRRAETVGRWDAWLDSPGGRLAFGLELDADAGTAALLNGDERIELDRVRWDGRQLEITIEPYDSTLTGTFADGTIDGLWRRTDHGGTETRMAFHAAPATGDCGPARPLPERWSVRFASAPDEPAVALLDSANGCVTGTFLTTTGDYRFLGGTFDGTRLRLSVFDGAHAFLFDATRDDAGDLAGDFWSRTTWHETWTATPDADAALPDAFAATRWVADRPLEEIVYPDLDGRPRALSSSDLGGVRLVEIFGSWCPNCNDAARYLEELDARYRERGLTIVGIAFEMTGESGRDADRVRAYARHHGIDYPLLLGGVSDKSAASRRFPWIDEVRAYPTFLFVDANDRVRAVYTGFSGPATGEAHDTLRREFEGWIERLLGESA